MSSTDPISQRDPQFPDSDPADGAEDGYLTWTVATFVGFYLLIMVPAWRLVLAARPQRRRIAAEVPRRPTLSEIAVLDRG